jgi:CheY-like chemotaxis protein
MLIDLMMPRMDGWAFRAAQLEDERLKHIPVVVLSGMGEARKPINADYVCRKPISTREILSLIQRFTSPRS